MKHLIETENPSGLPSVLYDRIILNSSTDDVIVRGGEYEYVDLGLSVKWAKMNVGATSETDYGDYFMWGSTKANTPDECRWKNAPFNGGNTNYNADAFNQVKDTACPNGILAKEYDTASQIMGSDWRMPTQAEFQELLNNTDNTRVNNFKGTGVNGWKFTSRVDENKYIFIPAAGYCGYGSVHGVGRYGCVWSSSLDGGYPYVAWGMGFNLFNFYMSNYIRYGGRSVRGVID